MVPRNMNGWTGAVGVAVLVMTTGGATGAWEPEWPGDAPPVPGPGDPAPVHDADHRYTGPGPVHFPAGHVEPVSGLGGLSVIDNVFDPIGGYVCQTPPGEGPCLPSHPSVTGRVFCNGITLRVDQGWDPAQDLWVWLGAPFDTIGKGYGVTCEKPRPATTGYVWHWGPL